MHMQTLCLLSITNSSFFSFSFSFCLADIINTPLLLVSILGLTGLISLVLACFGHQIIADYILKMPMPGVRCPRCLEHNIEQWVLPGKHCPRCNCPC